MFSSPISASDLRARIAAGLVLGTPGYLAPEVLVLELGANDGLRGLPLTAMRENLKAMIDASQAAGAKVLLVESTEYVGGTTAYSGATTWVVACGTSTRNPKCARNTGNCSAPFSRNQKCNSTGNIGNNRNNICESS